MSEREGRGAGTEAGAETAGDAAGSELAEVASRLHAVAIHLLRHAWARDAEMGLSRARASALSVLVFGGPRTLGELAEAEHVTPATMSRLVAALEGDGYLERRPHPSDARAIWLVPTPRARRVLRRGQALRVEALQGILRALEPAEQATVAAAVGALERALASSRGIAAGGPGAGPRLPGRTAVATP